MPEIVIATGNPHKVEELTAIFGELGLTGLRLLCLKDVAPPGGLAEPAETGTTFEANATIKALAYSAALNRPCIADDSGLEVDALGGRPGVISSHYATDGRETGTTREERDGANNARVLRELEGVPASARSARFRCVMVLAAPGRGVLAVASGAFEGRIGVPPDVPRGSHGFGYDPLFLVPPAYTGSSSELSPEAKNARSHRGEAARAMAGHLRSLTLV
jgi:XTP/dITP diphosphohydrolase